MNIETWKDIPGYEGLYQISDLGRVRSLGRTVRAKSNSEQTKRARLLTQEITIHGYCRVRLFDYYGKAKHFAVHRLVLLAFIGNSNLHVNHINEIKTDNRLINLEYCSQDYNDNYGNRNKKISNARKGKSTKKTLQYSLQGELIAEYSSRKEAGEKTGIDAKCIANCCSGINKTAGGFIWRNKN